MSRTKVTEPALSHGEMVYLLNLAGLPWARVAWVFGYAFPRSAQSLARHAAQAHGLPWLQGHTGDCEVLRDAKERLQQVGVLEALDRSRGARAYLLRSLGLPWAGVCEIMEDKRPNSTLRVASKFAVRGSLPYPPPVVLEALADRGRLLYEMAKDKPWHQVAAAFSLSSTGARNAAERYAKSHGLPWPIRQLRDNPGEEALRLYEELGTWKAVAEAMGYATPSSARDVAYNHWKLLKTHPWPAKR